MNKQYVQHMSGKGEIWEVDASYEWKDCYAIWKSKTDRDHFFLPRSEYHEIPAPEFWTDVTEGCSYESDGAILGPQESSNVLGNPIIGSLGKSANRLDYRLRKVQFHEISKDSFDYKKWVFIVEKLAP